MEEMKKELQKLCKKWREQTGKGSYPKGILTEKQKELKTASINCGRSEEKRDFVINSNEFKEFIDKFNIKSYGKETTSFDDLIIRLRY